MSHCASFYSKQNELLINFIRNIKIKLLVLWFCLVLFFETRCWELQIPGPLIFFACFRFFACWSELITRPHL